MRAGEPNLPAVENLRREIVQKDGKKGFAFPAFPG